VLQKVIKSGFDVYMYDPDAHLRNTSGSNNGDEYPYEPNVAYSGDPPEP